MKETRRGQGDQSSRQGETALSLPDAVSEARRVLRQEQERWENAGKGRGLTPQICLSLVHQMVRGCNMARSEIGWGRYEQAIGIIEDRVERLRSDLEAGDNLQVDLTLLAEIHKLNGVVLVLKTYGYNAKSPIRR